MSPTRAALAEQLAALDTLPILRSAEAVLARAAMRSAATVGRGELQHVRPATVVAEDGDGDGGTPRGLSPHARAGAAAQPLAGMGPNPVPRRGAGGLTAGVLHRIASPRVLAERGNQYTPACGHEQYVRKRVMRLHAVVEKAAHNMQLRELREIESRAIVPEDIHAGLSWHPQPWYPPGPGHTPAVVNKRVWMPPPSPC